ncbi:MAG: hypothetical protein O7A09_00640 [Proteobacteria bacterium]|nr:hypothetical protein [Pseudomonadota bacterium]
MYRKFLNARSPLRLLEKGLHGGLGIGNVGVLVAGHGMGKTSFLVGVALDELLRGGTVLHVALDQTVSHVRAYYDTVYEDLAASTHLDDAAVTHTEIDRRRSIRAYPPASFSPSKLREAVKVEAEMGAKPSLIVLEGIDLERVEREELQDLHALAEELAAELWLSVASREERVAGIPDSVAQFEDLLGVILALEPGPDGDDTVVLRALKDHDNPDLSDLHVALDPKTLLLVRH